MPTATVNKAGLRAAATTKRTRAAQRTPLPPKGHAANVALAQEAVAERVPVKRAARAAKAAPVKAAPPPAPAVKAKPTKATKASIYATELTQLGWTPVVTQTDGLTELIATRGTEAIYLAWMQEALVGGVSTYTMGDHTIKVRNAAEAMRIAAVKPDEAAAKHSSLPGTRPFAERQASPAARHIPFDPETASDAQVVDALEARAISWHNSYGGRVETATVGNAKQISVVRHPEGHRIVSFVDPQNGYRAFRLDRLVNVGRRVDLVKIKQAIIASLSQKAGK